MSLSHLRMQEHLSHGVYACRDQSGSEHRNAVSSRSARTKRDSAGQLDRTFGALAHPIRRGILERLARGEASVAELARPHRVSAPAITRHLRILEAAGLMARRRSGRVHRCRLVGVRMKEAARWIEHYRTFWTERLDALERYLKRKGERRPSCP